MELNNEELVTIVKVLCKENKELKEQLKEANEKIEKMKQEKEANETKLKFKELINRYQLGGATNVLALDKGRKSGDENYKDELKEIIREEVGERSYNTFFGENLDKAYIENNIFFIPCKDKFIRDVIEDRYKKLILTELLEMGVKVEKVIPVVSNEESKIVNLNKQCAELINRLEDVITGKNGKLSDETWLKEGLNNSYLDEKQFVIPCKSEYESKVIKDQYKELIETQLKMMGLDVNDIQTIIPE